MKRAHAENRSYGNDLGRSVKISAQKKSRKKRRLPYDIRKRKYRAEELYLMEQNARLEVLKLRNFKKIMKSEASAMDSIMRRKPAGVG